MFNKIIKKTKNSQKYKKKNIFHSVENRKGLMCANFKINGNTIKKPVFGGKGRYIIPITIEKGNSSNEYAIKISVKHKLLKTDKKYYVDYTLLKLCDDKTWNELIINWNNRSNK